MQDQSGYIGKGQLRCTQTNTQLQLFCAEVYLEVSERDVPVSGRVSVGAGHEQSVIFVQAADVLAMVGGGGGGVDLAGVERRLLRPVVVDVHAVQREPVLTSRLVKGVGHLKPEPERTAPLAFTQDGRIEENMKPAGGFYLITRPRRSSTSPNLNESLSEGRKTNCQIKRNKSANCI